MNKLKSNLEFGFKPRVPVILQAEATECGLACLAMVLGAFGNKIDLPTLRRRFSTSVKGSTLRDLALTADCVGLTTRAVRLDLREIIQLRLPCILHWRLNHFVVLTKIGKDKVTVHDPAFGRRVLEMDQVSRDFTGIAMELSPNTKFRKEDDRQTLRLRDMFRHISGLKNALIGLGALSLGLEFISIFMPMVSQIIIDEVVVTDDHELLITVACGVIILLLLQILISSIRQWSILILGTRVSLQWNSSLFDHLSRLPLDYFAKRHVGDILSRFNSLTTIQKSLTTDMVQSVMDGIMAVGMGIMLFIYGGWLAVVALIALVLDIGVRVFSYKMYREANEEQIVFNARRQSHFIETVRGMASIKLLGMRESRRSAWLNLLIDTLNVHLRIQRYDLVYGRITDLIFGSDRLIMMILGASAVMSGTMTVGMLVAFLSYKDQFASRVGNLVNSGFQLRMLNIQTDRLSDIVMSDTENLGDSMIASSSCFQKERTQDILSCEKLGIQYGMNDPWIFRDVSMTIPAESIIAIVGSSGCGKTTFLKALMGLSNCTEGKIFFKGKEVIPNLIENYRSRIAGVLQDDGLFSGSISDNICGFSEQPDQEWMIECAQHAAILSDIKKMPMGFETLVGDLGAGLSGGQKQRIILARALYRKPEILFLDEATSHLDEITEAKVAAALREMKITQVIVAHRPATIAHAQTVYVFQDDGSIARHDFKESKKF